MRSQLPPDPEWSRLERWILPVVYHGQSLSSAAFFCAWSFLVAFFMGATAVYTAFHYRPDWSILILVLAGLVPAGGGMPASARGPAVPARAVASGGPGHPPATVIRGHDAVTADQGGRRGSAGFGQLRAGRRAALCRAFSAHIARQARTMAPGRAT